MTKIKVPVACAMLLMGAQSAFAQDTGQDPSDAPVRNPVAAPETAANPAPSSPQTPSIQSSLGPLGDPGGIRAFLDSKGIDYNFTYIGEALGNPSGGYKQGATYEGRLDVTVDVDLDKLVGLKDFAFHSEIYDVHGRGLSGNNLKDLFTTSYIEAYPGFYLYEIWLEKKLLDGKLLVRAGQLAADTEFAISQTATLFINSSFGFPALFANDLPNGGPAYPLGTPGIRVKYQPDDRWTFLAAIFNGDPAGPPLPGQSPIAQQRDVGGVDFRLEDPPLVIGEAQYAYNQGKDAPGLPGTIKVGYLHHFEPFPAYDQPFAPDARNGGNNSAYAIIDQTVYRKPGTEDQGASVFGRLFYAPPDRNLIDVYTDAGISFKGMIPGRPDDTFGVSGIYAHISRDVHDGDLVTGAYPLVRDYQALIEATYQYVVTAGFTVQPDFQYVFHPGANGVGNPVTGEPIHNAAVYGLRATLHY